MLEFYLMILMLNFIGKEKLMKQKLILLGMLGFIAQFSYAADDIDLVNTHVTCGKFVLTESASETDITRNCNMQEMKDKKHLFRSNQTVLKFATDQYQLVACSFKKGSLNSCQVKEK